MPSLLITTGALHPDGQDAYNRYASVVVPLIEAAGGKVLRRGTFQEAIVGDDCPEFIAVMEFPDVDSIHVMFAGSAYRAAIPDRNLAFRDIRTFICNPL
ncbi:MAG: DUF1330 domain-containing protein [Acidobacteriia bacterium]|nr:DUF1330 domain-containing protein [Terriglobia bacterium]